MTRDTESLSVKSNLPILLASFFFSREPTKSVWQVRVFEAAVDGQNVEDNESIVELMIRLVLFLVFEFLMSKPMNGKLNKKIYYINSRKSSQSAPSSASPSSI